MKGNFFSLQVHFKDYARLLNIAILLGNLNRCHNELKINQNVTVNLKE